MNFNMLKRYNKKYIQELNLESLNFDQLHTLKLKIEKEYRRTSNSQIHKSGTNLKRVLGMQKSIIHYLIKSA